MKRSEAKQLINHTISTFRNFESDTSDENLSNHLMVSLEVIIDKINLTNGIKSSSAIYDNVFEQTGEVLAIQLINIEPAWEPEE